MVKNFICSAGLLILTLLGCSSAFSQAIQSTTGRDFIPVSPTAGSLGIFGDIPVGHYTGIPDISVPLHTLKYRELQVPIVMQYHAAGNKPDLIPGNVGLGWSLLTGGSISRIVNGIPDEGGYNNPDGQPIEVITPTEDEDWSSNAKMQSYLSKNQATLYDSGDPDEYHYNFNGISGRFSPRYSEVASPFGSTIDAQYKTISTQGVKLKIVRQEVTYKTFVMPFLTQEGYQNGYNQSFKKERMIYKIEITDDSGVKYIFGGSDNSIEFSRPGFHRPGFYGIVYPSERYIVPTTWHLTSIISPNGYSILFNYTRSNTVVVKYPYTDIHKFTWAGTNTNVNLDDYPVAKGEKATMINTCALSEVITPIERIVFTNSSASNQLWFSQSTSEHAIDYFQNYTGDVGKANIHQLYPHKVDKIEVFDKMHDEKKRKITFNYSNDNSTRLKLLSIEIDGNNLEEDGPMRYKFNYNSTSLPSYMSFMTDHYGFYNGRNDFINSSNPADYYHINQNAYYQSRESDENFSKAEILERITYPTGGYTEFDFELNDFAKEAKKWPFIVQSTPDSMTVQTGGLRIRKITSYQPNGEKSYSKRFFYVTNYQLGGTKSSGVKSYAPVFFESYSGTMTPPANRSSWGSIYNGPVTYWQFKSDPFYPMSPMSKGHVTYSEVAEVNDDNSFIIRKFKNYDNGFHDQEPLNWACDNVNLRAFYKDDDGTSLHLERGMTLSEELYRAGEQQPIQTTQFLYNDSQQEREENSIRVLSRSLNSLSIVDNIPTIRFVARLKYTYFPHVKEKIVHSIKNDGSIVETSTKFTFNSDRLLTEQVSYGSNTQEIKATYIYPTDMVDAGFTVPYENMLARHILSPVIEQQLTQNAITQRVRTNYFEWDYDTHAPISMETQIGNGPLELRTTYEVNGANGLLLSTAKNNDFKESLIWGYNNAFVIAKVMNASPSQIAHTSFELGSKGGWEYPSSVDSPDNNPVYTGRKCFSFSAGTINKSSLDPTITYWLTYWKKIGSTVIISGASFVGLEQQINGHNGWVQVKRKITNAISISISGSGYLDHLSLYPHDAMMTTATYDPVFGVTSKADTNDLVSYYDYDDLGRHRMIRDSNYEIVKLNEYNFMEH